MKWVKDKIWCWKARMQKYDEDIEEDSLLTIWHEVHYWNRYQYSDDATELICIRLIRNIDDMIIYLNSLVWFWCSSCFQLQA